MVAREVVGFSTAAVLEFDLAIVVLATGAITIGIMTVTKAVVVTFAASVAGDAVVALGFVESVDLRRYRVPVVSVHGLERIVHG